MIIALATIAAASLPFLSPIFGSHMVLQRDRPNPVWGWTEPGAKVKVRLGKVSAEAVAGQSGKWMATLPALPAGGPFKLEVDGPEKKDLEDIWMGEVWLCSGQSNMEFGMKQARNAATDIAQANRPMIRLFMVDRRVALTPEPSLGGVWKVCTPESVGEGGWGGFSAVAYHFGLELQEKLKVPIGLIQSAWGGTSGEAWTGAESLARTGEFSKELAMVADEAKSGGPVLGTYLERWIQTHDEGTFGIPAWSSAEYSSADWTLANLPSKLKDRELGWYRAEFDLPDPTPKEAYLHLGDVGGMDVAWVNGHQVGAGSGDWSRTYRVDGSFLKPGRNVFASRIAFVYGSGGLHASADRIYLEGGGQTYPLGPSVRFRLGASVKPGDEPRDFEANPTVPTVLRNGMIAPLAPLAIRGAIWYQGETNIGRGVQYAKILPALRADWRQLFQNKDLALHVVSLANWQERQDHPGDEYMAEIRESQAKATLEDRHCGVAMAYDVGDAIDIHPSDKTTVGHRLALCALALTYGERLEWSGPVFKRAHREGHQMRIEFDHLGGGLVANGELKGFAVAGEDHTWHWADAVIEGASVMVTCPAVVAPVAVRYAWQNNPPATLYNKAGLPAIPFRSDAWPLLSQHSH